ncbi:MAG: hypothetical protein D4R64_16615 [Porphyromonadaceae bacterium]|nr:MAG: hypothetical protein D4R64_16615 [Porphyromonadaceae bacterium]
MELGERRGDMKVIVTHDVDHLYSTEHLFDGILLKYAFRVVMERLGGMLSTREFMFRLGDLFRKTWHHVDEVMDFDEANGIPSTFFFAMNKGVGLNYDYHSALPVIQRVISRGFDCGVHGIEFEDRNQIEAEYQRFKILIGKSDFGIRMHYLRRNEGTLEKLNQAGYLFDSSEFTFKTPYKIGAMWEFPLHIMDSNEFYEGKSWQTEKRELIIEKTKDRIAKLAEKNYPYLTLLFHDRYFCSSYESYKLWYKEIIQYLKDNGHQFSSFKEVLHELES